MPPPPSSAPDISARIEAGSDPELLSLPTPPRRTRTLSLVLMALTSFIALSMLWALGGELRYAWRSGEPRDLGNLEELSPGPELANTFVRGKAELSANNTVSYERWLEPDSFQVAQVVNHPRLWIELRQSTTQALPQTSFVGRLVPLASAGLQYRGLAKRIEDRANVEVTRDTWLLVEGAAPASSRWAIALAFVLVLFAGWNVVQLLRLARRMRA